VKWKPLFKLIRELEEEEEGQVTEYAVEEAILSGVKVELNTSQEKAKIVEKVEPSRSIFSVLAQKMRGLFASSEKTTQPTENTPVKPAESNYKDVKEKNNRRPTTNRRDKYVARNQAENSEVKEKEFTTKNNRRNNKQNKNEEVIVPAVNEAIESLPQQAKIVVKPRRAQRTLDKKVRVANGNTVQQAPSPSVAITKPIAKDTTNNIKNIIIPSVLSAVVLKNEHNIVENENQTNRRPRRTSRHLRLNNQRRKKAKNVNYLSLIKIK